MKLSLSSPSSYPAISEPSTIPAMSCRCASKYISARSRATSCSWLESQSPSALNACRKPSWTSARFPSFISHGENGRELRRVPVSAMSKT